MKPKANSVSKQDESSSKNIDRQANLFNYLDNIKLSKDGGLDLISQTNSVERLQDVRPTDWSYQALKNLIERYGCISGFEDNTYRGTQNINRAEFAAGLNSCLNNVEKNNCSDQKHTSNRYRYDLTFDAGVSVRISYSSG